MTKQYPSYNSAVKITKICYAEPTRNLDYKIRCGDLEDLKECVKVIGKYNDFDSKIVNKELEKFAGKLADYWIGRDGGVAIYMQSRYWQEEEDEEFGEMVKEFALKTGAYECWKKDNGEWRIWWD